jgi:pyruvate,water dikinase
LLAVPQTSGLVPLWFVLRPGAFWASAGGLEQRLIKEGRDSAALESFWQNFSLAPPVRLELDQALGHLCPNEEACVVRSSALEEDGQRHSFAGQYDSFLAVAPGRIVEKIAAVWRSAFSERLRRYRDEQRQQSPATIPAILVQRMVNAEAAGVAFSADPVSGRRAVTVVSAVYGLGTSLVNGESDADTWKVERAGRIFSRIIGHKALRHMAGRDGIQTEAVAEQRRALPTLTDEQVRRVAQLARSIEAHFCRPQDIEWALADGKLWLLQTRPITTLSGLPDPDGTIRIWDNSNITESYSGVTTPLTFTFARRAYEGVYREFCHLLAVSPAKIAAHQATFREMLGLIQGRIYYNLLNWYRVLSLLPGFTFNRKFMEQMMGVKESLPADLLSQLDQGSVLERARDAGRLAWMCIVIVAHHCLLSRRIRRFEERLAEALQPPAVPLELQRADELAHYFRELERKLLTRWDAPLLNDFLTMIFTGVLRRLTASWCGDARGLLLPALLCGRSGIVSGQPARRMARLAEVARESDQLPALLCEGSLGEIQAALAQAPALNRGIAEYLSEFGDRCVDELELESLTLRDNPLPLYRSIGRLAVAPSGTHSASSSRPETDLQAAALETAEQQLHSHRVRRFLFQWVLRQARARTRTREDLRFERTRLFGRVRQIFVQLGARLAADGHLREPRDVFYLEVDEILGFLGGSGTALNLAALADLRKTEFERFRAMPAPPSRLTTTGSPYHGRPVQTVPQSAASPVACGSYREGVSCCPGRVRGIARVIRNPKEAQVCRGEILVAEHTDPGWILLFAGCDGLLVERGSLLSHSAIVARELGIPTIVGIVGLMDWLKDGDLIELDGGTGVVQRLSAEPETASHLFVKARGADPSVHSYGS